MKASKAGSQFPQEQFSGHVCCVCSKNIKAFYGRHTIEGKFTGTCSKRCEHDYRKVARYVH